MDSVRTQLLSVSGVTDVHSVHVWSLNMTHALLSVHVTAGRPTHSQDRGVTLPFNWLRFVLCPQRRKPMLRPSSLM